MLHPPCPLASMKAIVVCMLSWTWLDLAVLVLVGFFCLLRPAEYWQLSFEHFVWPETHDEGEVIYVAVPFHKASTRGPRTTHVRLDIPIVVSLLKKMRPAWPHSGRIFAGSPSSFRRRLQQVLVKVTGRPKLILPSSLRPGGASYFYRAWNEDVARLQWRGRWASALVLRHYIQEVAAVQLLKTLPSA